MEKEKERVEEEESSEGGEDSESPPVAPDNDAAPVNTVRQRCVCVCVCVCLSVCLSVSCEGKMILKVLTPGILFLQAALT